MTHCRGLWGQTHGPGKRPSYRVICVQIHRHSSLEPCPILRIISKRCLLRFQIVIGLRHFRTAPFHSVVPARAQMQLQSKAKDSESNPACQLQSVNFSHCGCFVLIRAQVSSALICRQSLARCATRATAFVGIFRILRFLSSFWISFLGVAAVTACRCCKGRGTGEGLEMSGVRQTTALTGKNTINYQELPIVAPSNSTLSARTAHQTNGELPTVCFGWHGGAKTFHASCVRL